MADYGIPTCDKVATIVGIHSRRCWEIRLGCQRIPHQAAQSIWRCAGRGKIRKGEKYSVGIELEKITPYD